MNRIPGRLCIALISALLVAACATTELHQQGLDAFEQGRYEEALEKLDQAVASDPANLTYKVDLKRHQEQAKLKLMAAGDRFRVAGDLDSAESAYRRVLAIESSNVRAQHELEGVEGDRRHAQVVTQAQQDLRNGNPEQADGRLRGVLAEDPGYAPAIALRAKIDAARGAVTVTPRLRTRDDRPVTLQFRDAATKMVFEVLSRQTGINFIFDKDVKSDGKTTIYVQEIPIEQAIDLVIGQNQLARQVLSDNMVLIYPNTPAKQKDYQDQIVKTFYLNTAAPKDVESLIKTVLDAKTLVVNERASAVIMRDTPENVRMAEKLVASVDISEAEVMLEVEVLEIKRSRLQQLGIAYPSSLKLSTPKDMTLNDLKNQNGDTISVSPLSVTLDALKTTGNANFLASPRIRARNREKAKVLIGSRVPVITSASSSSGNGGVVTNSQVQYLDVGLTLDVEPTIYADSDVAIKLSLEVSSITDRVTVGDTVAYEIGTRNFNTLLQLKDGETQILAGLIRDQDTHSASKIPGFGDIPVIGRLFSDHSTSNDKTEVVLSITPRIIRAKVRPSSDSTEFWFGTESRSGLAPLGSASRTASGPAPALARAQVDVSTTGTGTVVGAPVNSGTGAAPSMGESAAATPAASRFNRFRGATGVSAVKPADGGGAGSALSATIDGPSEVKVGDEFTVTVQMQTDQNIPRVRAQLRFDVSTFQFVSGGTGRVGVSGEWRQGQRLRWRSAD